MNATAHFPRWTAEEFVAPEGWTDDSWRDDTMPKWVSPCGQYWLWVDYANPEDRENGKDSERFCLVRALEDDPFGLFFTESFNEMVRFIKGL